MTPSRAPIALFVYARPDHARQTVEALKRNLQAGESDLIVFSDAPRRPDAAGPVGEVRRYIRDIDGFKSLRIVERESNLGLAQSIIAGVTDICDAQGRVIVLEDDLITSPYFLTYMNDALDKYADTPQVAAVSGFHPPFRAALPESFFQRDAECWGWGTWKRAWAKFNPNGKELLAELKRRDLLRIFDQDGSYPYVRMLEEQIAGHNSSWAIRWRACVFLADMLSLYPRHSLVRNIGLDGSGTHGGTLEFGGAQLCQTPVRLESIPLVHSQEAFQEFVGFNKRLLGRSLKDRSARGLRRLIGSLMK